MDEPLRSVERSNSFPITKLDYVLPPELIAQTPPARREDARLLVVDQASDAIFDRVIVDLPGLLRRGDLLVLNDTRVLPAKFTVRRKTGGALPGLFVEEESPGRWRVLLEGSKRLQVGETLTIDPPGSPPVTVELLARLEGGDWRVQVGATGTAEEILDRVGRTPLPPYIRRGKNDRMADQLDRARYQTVYAQRPGAVAAPTAGLHLTEPLLDRLRTVGVDVAFVTLHVGLGTFKPITVDDLSQHAMHAERYELPARTAEAVAACRLRSGRVIAVGTTTVRVLESAAQHDGPSLGPSVAEPALKDKGPLRRWVALEPRHGTTNLLIYPPHEFRVVDVLLTNFHLPRSTLLALVMAFAGVERTRRAYAHAIEKCYRFYSFGDAMRII